MDFCKNIYAEEGAGHRKISQIRLNYFSTLLQAKIKTTTIVYSKTSPASKVGTCTCVDDDDNHPDMAKVTVTCDR